MPQNWKANWPMVRSEDADEKMVQAALARRANAVNALGNLTLTNGRLNSKMRDAAWSEKEGHLRSKSTFLITTASILSKPPRAPWTEDRAWADNWTEDNIDCRTMELVMVALEVWSRPDIDPVEDEDADQVNEDDEGLIEGD